MGDNNTLRYYFYGLWLAVNFFQAAFTNLLYDEAYYWVSSLELQWGYFYHPPLINPLIRAGYFLFSNELGVRFFFVLSSTAGIYLMEKLLLKQDLRLYYAIMLSILFFQVLGILAAPDIPLFLLSVTFYLVFRRFLEKEDLLSAILLAVNTALLLYTKYHGILLIGFSFLYNFRWLICRWKSYVWVFLSMVLFLPHVLWQINQGFPTVMFHLFERPGGGAFEWNNLLDYIPGQLLISGPLTGFVLFWSLLKVKVESRIEKTMLFNLLSMYIFFFMVSFYHHIEANWTVVGIPALVVLSHKSLTEQPKLRRWVFRLLPYSLVLSLAARILLLFPHWLEGSRLDTELHGFREWALTLKEVAAGKPVVFDERYQRPSAYAFYSRNAPVFTLNPDRKSDFDYLDFEEPIQGKTVLFASRANLSGQMDSLETVKGRWYVQEMSNFHSYKRIRLELNDIIIEPDGTLSLLLGMYNPYERKITFQENPGMETYVGYILYKDGKKIAHHWMVQNAAPLVTERELLLALPRLASGEYAVQFTLKTGWLPAIRSSRIYQIVSP